MYNFIDIVKHRIKNVSQQNLSDQSSVWVEKFKTEIETIPRLKLPEMRETETSKETSQDGSREQLRPLFIHNDGNSLRPEF